MCFIPKFALTTVDSDPDVVQGTMVNIFFYGHNQACFFLTCLRTMNTWNLYKKVFSLLEITSGKTYKK